MNTFGHLFRLTTFGESHGIAIGGVVDGMIPKVSFDKEFIQKELNRRKPGQSSLTTQRKETDEVEFLSGIFEGKTTGMPIGFMIKNGDHHSTDYEELRNVFRPSHADFTYEMKYGIRDHRGGGRSSARETASWVVGGAIAKLALKQWGIQIYAYTSQIGNILLSEEPVGEEKLHCIENNIVRCPEEEIASKMQEEIEDARREGDSVGGVISCIIKGLPVGIGSPVFHKFHTDLAGAMLSINASKGFEYGMGFKSASCRGSQINDPFYCRDNEVHTRTNYSGGVQGGITNGEDVFFRVAFKPTPTILQTQDTLDKDFNSIQFKAKGRHDPCVVPRAVPIVEALASMVSLDHILLNQQYNLSK